MKYNCMSRPCSITTDDKLWCIAGRSDKYGSGILSWCHDKDDAEFWYNQMKDDPDFTTISYHKYIEDPKYSKGQLVELESGIRLKVSEFNSTNKMITLVAESPSDYISNNIQPFIDKNKVLTFSIDVMEIHSDFVKLV